MQLFFPKGSEEGWRRAPYTCQSLSVFGGAWKQPPPPWAPLDFHDKYGNADRYRAGPALVSSPFEHV